MDRLGVAIDLHQRGLWEQAAAAYREVLAGDPKSADAWHLLGVLAHQCGDQAQAQWLIGRALDLLPGEPAFLANLAEVHRATAEYTAAVACCRAALERDADFPPALNNLGLALHGLGELDQAADCLQRAVQLQPDSAPACNSLGLVYRTQGRLDDALREFARAAELDPEFAAARTNLGQALLDLGRAEEALPHCAAAVQLQPTVAALHFNLALALRAVDRTDEAQVELQAAIALDDQLAAAHSQLGKLLDAAGKPLAALDCLRRAAELEPQRVEAWDDLANEYEKTEDYAGAIPCWRHTVKLKPNDARRRVWLGWSLQEEGRLAEAIEQYEEALRLDRATVSAFINLAAAREELGQFNEAEAALRAALRVKPDQALVYARLATLLRGELPPADEQAIHQALTDPGLDPSVRTRLLFALGHVCEARQAYVEAAQCWNEANALAASQMPTDYRRYDPVRHERFVGGLIETFSAELFARLAEGGARTARPVFVVGLPRSGTTLIEQLLASHSQVHGAGELRVVRRLFERLPRQLNRGAPPLACVSELDSSQTVELAAAYLRRLEEIDGARSARIVDKMPDNYLYLGFLALLFPQATFIHCRRDVRDVAVSCWSTDFCSIRWASDPQFIAGRFAQHRRLMDHWRSVLPVPLHEIDYEEVVADSRTAGQRLFDWCGLPWEEQCLEFYRTKRPVRTASVRQVRQPIYSSSVGRWQRYRQTLGGLLASLEEDKPFESQSGG